MNVVTSLDLYIFGAVAVVIGCFEFIHELLTPFGENAKYSWALYSHTHSFYFFLVITRSILRYFPPNHVLSVLSNLRTIFLFLFTSFAAFLFICLNLFSIFCQY
jgi:hypothetical protein